MLYILKISLQLRFDGKTRQNKKINFFPLIWRNFSKKKRNPVRELEHTKKNLKNTSKQADIFDWSQAKLGHLTFVWPLKQRFKFKNREINHLWLQSLFKNRLEPWFKFSSCDSSKFGPIYVYITRRWRRFFNKISANINEIEIK